MRSITTVIQVQQVNRESNDMVTYSTNMAPITFKTGFELFLFAVVIFEITVGILHLNDCPVNHLIPIYLVSVPSLKAYWVGKKFII